MKPGKSYDLIDWAGASFVDVDVSDLGSIKVNIPRVVISLAQNSSLVFCAKTRSETPPEFPNKPKPIQRETIKDIFHPRFQIIRGLIQMAAIGQTVKTEGKKYPTQKKLNGRLHV